jgi:hypothetical protein
MGARDRLRRFGTTGKERVRDAWDQKSNRPGAIPSKNARRLVRHITQLLDDAADSGQGPGINTLSTIDDAGNSCGTNAGCPGYFAEGRMFVGLDHFATGVPSHKRGVRLPNAISLHLIARRTTLGEQRLERPAVALLTLCPGVTVAAAKQGGDGRRHRGSAAQSPKLPAGQRHDLSFAKGKVDAQGGRSRRTCDPAKPRTRQDGNDSMPVARTIRLVEFLCQVAQWVGIRARSGKLTEPAKTSAGKTCR